MGPMRSRRLSALVLGLLAVVVLGVGAAPAFAQANQTGGPAPITDYANYPLGLGLIPTGCTAQGPAILEGEMFSVDGSTPVPDMRALPDVTNTSVLTMTWDAFAPGCETVGITLSRKISATPAFNPADNQYLNVWSYCGPGGNPCTGPFSLTLDLRLAAPVACYQVDANIGPPLNVVGPNTAYYSYQQPFDMLISAKNGGTEPCATEPPCATNPSIPGSSAECQGTTTVPTTTPTTTPPPTVTTEGASGTTTSTSEQPAPPPPGGQPTTSVTVCGANQQFDATTGQCVAVLGQGTGQLPFTGSRSGDLARGGIAVVVAGLLMLVAAKRWRSASSPTTAS